MLRYDTSESKIVVRQVVPKLALSDPHLLIFTWSYGLLLLGARASLSNHGAQRKGMSCLRN